jgi:hypothetical protein
MDGQQNILFLAERFELQNAKSAQTDSAAHRQQRNTLHAGGMSVPMVLYDGEGSPRVRGFTLSNVTVHFIPPNVTSHVQPLDAGIINSFKAGYRKLHIRWILHEMESERVVTAAGARPDLKLAIQWISEAWKEVKTTTIRNCWNKTELLLLARIDCPHPEVDAALS